MVNFLDNVFIRPALDDRLHYHFADGPCPRCRAVTRDYCIVFRCVSKKTGHNIWRVHWFLADSVQVSWIDFEKIAERLDPVVTQERTAVYKFKQIAPYIAHFKNDARGFTTWQLESALYDLLREQRIALGDEYELPLY